MTQKPYCKPLNAGLNSETSAVCRRLGRFLTSLDVEINSWIVEGRITDDIREFKFQLMQRLEAEGWTMSYDGSDRMKVRQPGHKRPFHNRMVREG